MSDEWTLEDWFAGQALAGLMADSEFDTTREKTAVLAYDMAEAMIAEKNRRDEARKAAK